MSATEPLTIAGSSARPSRTALRSRTFSRRYDLPAALRRRAMAPVTRTVRPALMTGASFTEPASSVAEPVAADRRSAWSAALPASPRREATAATLRTVGPRITPLTTSGSRVGLIDRAAPAVLLGGTQTLGGLTATWPLPPRRGTAAGELTSPHRRSGAAASLPGAAAASATTAGRLRATRAAGRGRAAWLAAVPSTSSSFPSERVESTAERTGSAVAEAVIATFERLVPSVVARALSEAERRLMNAI